MDFENFDEVTYSTVIGIASSTILFSHYNNFELSFAGVARGGGRK